MKEELKKTIYDKVTNKQLFSTAELRTILHEIYPELSGSTLAWKINQLKNENFIYQVGRGLYSFDNKPDYIPELILKTKRTYNRVKGLCPGQRLVVWDSLLLSSILEKEFRQFLIFFSLPKNELEPLFNGMLDFSKQIFLYPDKEVANRYLAPLPEAIVLTPLVSETPLQEEGDYIVPTIEGLLVCAWFEYENILKSEGFVVEELFEKAFQKYKVNRSKLLRFASRRDKKNEFVELLKNIK